VVWELRKGILEQKDVLDRLLRRRDDAERQARGGGCPFDQCLTSARLTRDSAATTAPSPAAAPLTSLWPELDRDVPVFGHSLRPATTADGGTGSTAPLTSV
jgi:hypothetical protein